MRDRKWYPSIGKAIGILLAVVLVLGLTLQIDDNLDPSAAALLEWSSTDRESLAYFYLAGIDAPEGADPVAVGMSAYGLYQNRAHSDAGDVALLSSGIQPDGERLPLPSGDLFCAFWADGCLARLFRSQKEIESVLVSNDTLLRRYTRFVAYDDYATLTSPADDELLLPFPYLIRGSRLVELQSINEAISSNHNQALRRLLDNIDVLRRQLALQDTLVGKVVFLDLISENLDLAYLISQHADEAYQSQLLPLSRIEWDFGRVISREFAVAYHSFQSLDGNPEFWQSGGDAPGWSVRLVFKPNMTANSVLPHYIQAIRKVDLSPHAFSQSLSSESVVEVEGWSIRNSVGLILGRIAFVNYDEFIAQFHDLNAKIHLFNSLMGRQDIEAVLGQVYNPYYDRRHRTFFNHDSKAVCFDGPLPDERNQRCLRIEI